MSKNPERYADDAQYLRCPICRSPLHVKKGSLLCSFNHCYDVSKDGYVNLVGKAKSAANYDKDSFGDRHFILEQGVYEPVLDEVVRTVWQRCRPGARVLDAGCGEGYYANRLRERTGLSVFAIDLSRDSVQLGAKSDAADAVKWIVGDLANLPFQDASIDCVLDVFSPANYGEFRRVLARRGFVVKVVPGERHLAQLREKAQSQLRRRRYSNQKVVDRFEEFFTCASRTQVAYERALTPEERAAFVGMTPLLFNVEKGAIDWDDVAEVTIEAEVLVGLPRT